MSLVKDAKPHSRAPHSVTAVALTPVKLFHVPGRLLREMTHESCFLRHACEQHLARARVDRRCDLLLGERRNLEARIRWLLRSLPRAGQDETGVLVRLPFTLATVARLLNSRQESLSRALRRLERQGICHLEGRSRIRVYHGVGMDQSAGDRPACRCPGLNGGT